MVLETQRHRGTESFDFNDINQKTSEIIGCAVEVHRVCGPGLLEKVYRDCLRFELEHKGFKVETEKTLEYKYKDSNIVFEYRLDMLIDKKIVLELKSVSAVMPVHEAQLLTYLKLGNYPCGLLINFYSPILTKGVIRKLNFPVNTNQENSVSL